MAPILAKKNAYLCKKMPTWKDPKPLWVSLNLWIFAIFFLHPSNHEQFDLFFCANFGHFGPISYLFCPLSRTLAQLLFVRTSTPMSAKFGIFLPIYRMFILRCLGHFLAESRFSWTQFCMNFCLYFDQFSANFSEFRPNFSDFFRESC